MSPSSGTQRRGGLRGHPAPGKQARPCARAAAMALAARGSLVPVCPTPRAARWRPAPTPAIGSPPSGPRRPCPALACIQPAPRPRAPRAPDPVPAHRPAALGAAPRSTPPARLRLRAAGRAACFPGTVTLTVLWQVSTGAPARPYGSPTKVTQTPEPRGQPRSIPGRTGL